MATITVNAQTSGTEKEKEEEKKAVDSGRKNANSESVKPVELRWNDEKQSMSMRMNPNLTDKDGWIVLGTKIKNPDGAFDFVNPDGEDMLPSAKFHEYNAVMYPIRNLIPQECSRVIGHLNPDRTGRANQEMLNAYKAERDAYKFQSLLLMSALKGEFSEVNLEMYLAFQEATDASLKDFPEQLKALRSAVDFVAPEAPTKK